MYRVPQGKITVPPLPADFTSRSKVLTHLSRARPDQLLLVSAPAGYGKTLALADWVRLTDTPTLWVIIDRGDDSPRLWSAVLGALAALPTGPVDTARRRGHLDSHVGPDGLIDQVVEAIEAVGAPLRLVLDDVNLLAVGEPL